MHAARSFIRSILRKRDYDVRRYVTECGSPISLLRLAVAAYLANNTDLYFVQIGANDGITDDALYPLVREHRLSGLLVEPMPDAFDRLLATYADHSQLAFENCALWTEDGERDFFRVRVGAYHNPLVKGMAGFSREALLDAARFFPGLAGNIETMRVRTMTPKGLFRKHSVSRIDLLQVDTEGFDDEIIRLVLETGLTPAIIRYEHIHLSADSQDSCAQYLNARGYRFARTRTDTLAVIEDAMRPSESALHATAKA